MVTGYCTVDDVRRALQETVSEFDSGAWGEDTNQVVVDAITAQTEWLEKTTKRHWYEPDGIQEDDHDLIPTGPKTRDDEYDIPTGATIVSGEVPAPKTAQGDYAKIELARRDAESVSELLVRTGDGSFEDWTSTYSGGTWPEALGDDYYLRVNNGGWSRLYIDTTNLLVEDEDDEYVLDSFANAVYLSFEYGHEGIPQNVRRAVAFRAGAELLMDDQANLGIPENSQLVSTESKKQAMESKAEELLEVYR